VGFRENVRRLINVGLSAMVCGYIIMYNNDVYTIPATVPSSSHIHCILCRHSMIHSTHIRHCHAPSPVFNNVFIQNSKDRNSNIFINTFAVGERLSMVGESFCMCIYHIKISIYILYFYQITHTIVAVISI